MFVSKQKVIIAMLGTLFLMMAMSTVQADPPKGWKWKLIWSDEFNSKSMDFTKWQFRLGKRCGGESVKEAVSFDGNNLVMRCWEKDGHRYTGGIYTKPTFSHCYGYYEIRCQFPKKDGHWFSFWLQAYTTGLPVYTAASSGTEVDIFEYYRVGTEHLSHNIYWGLYPERPEHIGHESQVPGLTKGFHTVGYLWTPNENVIYADGREVWRTQYGVSNQKEYIEITDLVFNDLPKNVKLADDVALVDYVRVYEMDNDILKPEIKKDGKFVQIAEVTTSEAGSLLLKNEIVKNLPKVLTLPETTLRNLPLVELKENEVVQKKLQNLNPSDGITDEVYVKVLPWSEQGKNMGFILKPMQLDTIRPIGSMTDQSGKMIMKTRFDRSLTSRQFARPDTWYILGDFPAGDTAGQKRTILLYRLLIHDSHLTTQPCTKPVN